jgi:hypothetical protein
MWLVGIATVTTHGLTARYDTTNEEWGLLSGRNRGPRLGHQWGLVHGHGPRADARWVAVAARMCTQVVGDVADPAPLVPGGIDRTYRGCMSSRPRGSGEVGAGHRPPADGLRQALKPNSGLPVQSVRRQRVVVTGIDEGVRPAIEAALADLASRLGRSPDRIVVEAAGSVTWSDQSCGCARPGRAYPQVPIDGTYVRLAVGSRTFHYHGGGRREMFLCE